MKLISKTILYYVLISLPLLLISVFFSYSLIREELRDGTDEDLMKESLNAERRITANEKIHDTLISFDNLSTITRIKSGTIGAVYSDTTIYDTAEHEPVQYRMLKSVFMYNAATYRITVLRTNLEEQELVEGLLTSFAFLTGLLLFSFFIVNWLISKTLWKPFYQTLGSLNAYELQHHTSQHPFERSKITEFNQLNTTLNKMTEKIYSDFIQQKEFTENASHEMQTPLAVIKANLFLLMQSPHLKEEEMNQLQAIDNTTKKLASLNKALIILSKIENNQFKESETLNLKDVIHKNLDIFSELLQAKNIQLAFHLQDDLFIKINPALADMLITNLLQNAIRHNKKGGNIKIDLSANSLIIANSGEPLNIPTNSLFVRFKKNDASKDSLGLGLSIVKSIVSHHHFSIHYSYPENMHTFTIHFK